MRTPAKIALVAVLTVAVIGAVALKKGQTADKSQIDALAANALAMTGLPRLLDLGADKCIPCKMMFPVLEELKKEYAGKMEVGFIDVWQHPEAGKAFGVEVIPTQIFYDADGKELFRHVGFFGKEDILAKWKELGVDLNAAPAAPRAGAKAANQVVEDTNKFNQYVGNEVERFLNDPE